MLVTAFDDRDILPGFFVPFLNSTLALSDLRLISPARANRPAGDRFRLEIMHPDSLPSYQHAKRLFDGMFVNYSTNPADFERACFQRWFAINAAASSLADDDFVCLLDTDFILGMSPPEILARCQAHAAGRRLRFIAEWREGDEEVVMPQITIMTKSFLFGFCEYLLTVYFAPEMRGRLIREYFGRIGRGADGGICDMRALASYGALHKDEMFNIRQLPGYGMVSNFNGFLNSEIGRTDAWKIVVHPDGHVLQVGSRQTPLIGVHFQGSAKTYMSLLSKAGDELTCAACERHRALPPETPRRAPRGIARFFRKG